MTPPDATLKRSTAGGLAGVFAALAQYLAIPPTVIQELLLKIGHIDVSVDLAAFIGTAVVGMCGWAATEFQGGKQSTEQTKEPMA